MRIKYANNHHKFILGRDPDKRYHLIRTLVTQLITHERIYTTSAKAKHMRSTVEAIIAIAKRVVKTNRHCLKQTIKKIVRTRYAQEKLLTEIVPRVLLNNGSCTRIKYVKNRKGDNAPISYIEIIGKLVNKRNREKRKATKGGGYKKWTQT